MSHKKVLLIILVFSIYFFASFRGASESTASGYNVSGYVSSNSGFLYDVSVKATNENTAVTSVTDINGYYIIFSLPDGTYDFIYSKTGYENGSSKITISGTDITDANITLSDTAPPTVTISSPSNGSLLNTTTITVSGTASDTGSGVQKVEVSVDGGALAPAAGTTSWSFTTPALLDGTHTITARATDNAGNTKEASITVTSDTTSPTIAITYPTDGQVFTVSSIDVNGTASDNIILSKVEVKIGTGDWQPASGAASWSMQVNLSEGSNVIYARATDTAENTREISITVTSNTLPPVSVSSPQTKTAIGSFFINNSWVNPADADFSYVLFKYSNGTDLQNVASPTDYLNLQWQPHDTQNISAQTVDKYGNINQMLVWFNATIPNNPPVQLPIGNKEVYKGQLLTFDITTTDIDSDTITYGTSATKGHLNSSTGIFTWTPGDSDAGEYIWEFNSSDGYGGVANETIRINVINPLDIDLKFIEPYIIIDNGTWYEAWRDTAVGHLGKFIGYNSTFKNAGNVSLAIAVTPIYNNETRDDNSFTVTLANNEAKPSPYRLAFEINSTGVNNGVFNFTLQTKVKGFNDTDFIFDYINSTTISLRLIPIFKIKQANADIIMVNKGETTTVNYTLEANSTVNLTSVSISDPLYTLISGKKNYSLEKLEANKPRNVNYSYPVTSSVLPKYKCEEGYACIINIADFTGYDPVNKIFYNDTDYVEICVNCIVLSDGGKGSRGGSSSSGGGGGGIPPSEDFNNIERREVREMDVLAKLASAYIFRFADPVMVVSFESSVSENGVPVSVEVLKNRSKNIQVNAPGILYKNFNVFVGRSGFSRKVSNGVIVFQVSNRWLANNGLDPEDISLYKWQGGWVKKGTEIAERKQNYTYYVSLVGNFSSFAIAGTKEQKLGSAYVTVPDNPMPSDELMKNATGLLAGSNFSNIKAAGGTSMLSTTFILILGITGIVIYLNRKHKKIKGGKK